MAFPPERYEVKSTGYLPATWSCKVRGTTSDWGYTMDEFDDCVGLLSYGYAVVTP